MGLAPFSLKLKEDNVKFIDFIILIIVMGILIKIAYSSFIKKDKDICSRCPYKRPNCNCMRKG